jgi:hypothetical protein
VTKIVGKNRRAESRCERDPAVVAAATIRLAETKIVKVGQYAFDFTKWAIKNLKRRFLESKFFAANLT